jgi:hypothetical protein
MANFSEKTRKQNRCQVFHHHIFNIDPLPLPPRMSHRARAKDSSRLTINKVAACACIYWLGDLKDTLKQRPIALRECPGVKFQANTSRIFCTQALF